MRIFITAIKQSGNARNLRDVLESCDTDACNASLLDQNFDENLPADDYRYVYALSSNVEKNDIAAFVKNTALHLVILAKFTPTFGDIFDRENFDLENLVNNDDILFMGAVLLKYCAVCDFHALGNYRVPDCKEELACGRPGYGPISWSLGLKTSLARRNCVPNTRRFMIGSNKVILFTILPIEEGAQIIDAHSDMNYSHLSIFDDVPKIERQMAFQKRYGFTCGCRSCEEYWPEITYEANYMHQYLQLKTSDSLSEECNKLCDLFLGFNESFCRSSAAEKMHRFALCIDQCMEVCPLPSEIPACMVRSLCAVMLTSFGYFCQPQVSEKCHR
ncbi:hypothetical protein QAD02_011600 [Eretmocerus hayati]|uniref:Uncharacterized protein n=1 Tax=Eretmocerus hayati TaxID=131215 RepID=A0ACC2NZU9_9HYME|nr:hypothetical protein QAD02_011600 [Eretmocerus hayati]